MKLLQNNLVFLVFKLILQYRLCYLLLFFGKSKVSSYGGCIFSWIKETSKTNNRDLTVVWVMLIFHFTSVSCIENSLRTQNSTALLLSYSICHIVFYEMQTFFRSSFFFLLSFTLLYISFLQHDESPAALSVSVNVWVVSSVLYLDICYMSHVISDQAISNSCLQS